MCRPSRLGQVRVCANHTGPLATPHRFLSARVPPLLFPSTWPPLPADSWGRMQSAAVPSFPQQHCGVTLGKFAGKEEEKKNASL